MPSHDLKLATVVTLAALPALCGCTAFLSAPADKWPEPEDLTVEQPSVWSMAYSPDGKYLISSHIYQRPSNVRSSHIPGPAMFQLWGTGSCFLAPEGLLATFLAPDWQWRPDSHRFSPDGRVVFTATSRGLLRWDIAQQQLQQKFAGHQVVLSPDCRQAICKFCFEWDDPRGEDRPVELWDVEQGQRIGVLGTENSFGSPVEFLPDGQRLLTVVDGPARSQQRLAIRGMRDQTTTMLDVSEPFSHAFAFSADGRRIAVHEEGQFAHILDTASGKCLASIPSWENAGRICLSPSGELLAICGESSDTGKKHGEIQIWDVDTARLRKTLTDSTTWGITAVCFSPDGNTLASGDGDGRIQLWKIPPAEAAASDR